MRIKTLTLQNFRSHRATEFALDRVNVVRGPNGSGKSSLQMAIEYALTGRCAVTDAAGRGADALVTLGAKELVVGLVLGDATLTRTRNLAGGSLLIGLGRGKQALDSKQAEAWLQGNLAAPDVLSAVLNSARFVAMNEKEQKALLAGALASEPVEIDAEIMKKHWFLATGESTCWARVESPAQVDAEHKRLFDRRADAKRELAAMGELAEPAAVADAPTRQQVFDKINSLMVERNQALARQSVKLQEWERQSGKLKAEYQCLLQRLQSARDTLANMGSWVIDSSEEIERLQKQLRSKGDAAKFDTQIAKLAAQIQNNRERVAELKAQPTECPTCHRALDREPVDTSAIEGTIRADESLLKELREKRSKLADFAAIEKRLERHQQASPQVVAAEATIAEIGNYVEPEFPAQPDTSAEDAEIETLDNRIAEGRKVEQRVIELEAKQTEYRKQAERRTRLAKQIEALEKLVEYFGPKGSLKAKLIGGKLPAFRDRINQVLARFGFECFFELEPYTITVMGRTLKQLSESEAYRFGIAFQVALAEATGLGLVIIDRADMLTNDSRRLLTAELIDSTLEQVIVLSTGEPIEQFPDIAGVAFFELENQNGISAVRAEHHCQESINV